ncbi:TetR/AcrR family transcriptional regulator [Streptosporangium sp. NBC_01639]|uniref:TetR/AcrR family transcriptional regulator n=1 Tax=unclassified Streptosporangium TaxID=2632669 RepID=UPI002DD99075|nr:TetR/AcrR family transcriptional regulator [Streptosporangium sp. NBC_01756]WSC88885.1 TetR/AcrR family transcriptional regulator [Streptosporangium sp. NBC_01756]WTD52426.1 TetR/AcrR family transcriptional regulator [Streptosporangium sp. NBC_01639]
MRREELLDAAEDLLCDQGSAALTLAAVAERAGCSKGGLLYHFGTKEALIKGMVERLIEDFDQLVAAQGRGTYTKDYLAATFAAVQSGRLRRWAVVTGASGNLYLLAPLRTAMARWHREGLDTEPDPVAAQIVRLACEGLWDVASHDPDLYDDAHYAALKQRLLDLLPA